MRWQEHPISFGYNIVKCRVVSKTKGKHKYCLWGKTDLWWERRKDYVVDINLACPIDAFLQTLRFRREIPERTGLYGLGEFRSVCTYTVLQDLMQFLPILQGGL